MRRRAIWIYALAGIIVAAPLHAATVVYRNDFESPIGFVPGFHTGPTLYSDVSQQEVNDLYGSNFGQSFTVETLNVSGSSFTGAGSGNDYALGMLSSVQPDRLWVTFDVGADDFVNVELRISAIDLNGSDGATLVEPGVIPTFQLTLFDGSATATVAPTGPVLDSAEIDGTATTLVDRYAFDWTNHLVPLSALGNATGTVTLQIDLLDGGYASFDDLTIATSDQTGDVTPVPGLPGLGGWLLGAALMLLGTRRLASVP